MSNARAFFDRLSSDYESLIRQLVPRYEELSETVQTLVRAEGPLSVLEIGAGTGASAVSLLRSLPSTRLTAVEDSPEMKARAVAALLEHADRAQVVRSDIRDFTPAGRVDAVYASLVLHNVHPVERQALLERIVSWLRPGGLFVWAEFLRFEDPAVQAAVETARQEFARDAGCPEDVVAWNFKKEAEEDFPPTVEEVLVAARSAGFASADLVWAHDAFAVFSLRAER